MENKYEIFISYSRKDLDKVLLIKEEIEDATNAKCWMDLEGISYDSPDFVDVIVKAIEETPIFLFMLSEHSQISKIARGEISLAQKKGKHISLVNIDNCEMSDTFTILYSQNNFCDYSINNQKSKLFNEINFWLGKEKPDLNIYYKDGDITHDTLFKIAVQLYERKAYIEAHNIFLGLSKKGNIAACFYIGIMSLHGEGTKYSIDKGINYLSEAAQKNYVDAQYTLGQIYEKGLYGIQKNLKESLFWYEKAAKQNHDHSRMALMRLRMEPYSGETIALYEKGLELYHKGKFEESMSFFLNACKHNHTPSMRLIASMYELGQGVKQSYSQTFEWLNKAIVLGDVDAEYESKKLRHELTGQ